MRLAVTSWLLLSEKAKIDCRETASRDVSSLPSCARDVPKVIQKKKKSKGKQQLTLIFFFSFSFSFFPLAYGSIGKGTGGPAASQSTEETRVEDGCWRSVQP